MGAGAGRLLAGGGLLPGSPAAGVDVMIGADWTSVAVAEVNAFGDLLPGLTGFPGSGAEDLDAYDTQVRAMMGSTCGT
nr:hypothetical protein GCM10020093_003480 [Planobispora longispora]